MPQAIARQSEISARLPHRWYDTCGGLLGLLLSAFWLAAPAHAQTSDMTGAWATKISACDKIFAKRNGKISFRSGADRHGKGFILDRDRIRGRVATCKIEWYDGAPAKLIAMCSGLVMDTARFTLTVLDAQRLGWTPPGRAEPEIYQRCWQ